MPVLADDVGLRSKAVTNIGDIAQIYRRGSDLFNRKIVELSDRPWTGVQAHVIFKLADLGGASGQNQVLIGQR